MVAAEFHSVKTFISIYALTYSIHLNARMRIYSPFVPYFRRWTTTTLGVRMGPMIEKRDWNQKDWHKNRKPMKKTTWNIGWKTEVLQQATQIILFINFFLPSGKIRWSNHHRLSVEQKMMSRANTYSKISRKIVKNEWERLEHILLENDNIMSIHVGDLEKTETRATMWVGSTTW